MQGNRTRQQVADPFTIGWNARGFVRGNLFPEEAANNSQLASGTLVAALVPFLEGELITNLHTWVATAGVTLTSAQAALYSRNGQLLASSASLPAQFQATGLATFPLTTVLGSSFSFLEVTTDDSLYVAFLSIGGTQPFLQRGLALGSTWPAAPAGSAGSIAHVTMSGQAALPQTLTFTNGTTGFAMAAS